eukprot:3700214-Prymnesium_polylepis.1
MVTAKQNTLTAVYDTTRAVSGSTRRYFLSSSAGVRPTTHTTSTKCRRWPCLRSLLAHYDVCACAGVMDGGRAAVGVAKTPTMRHVLMLQFPLWSVFAPIRR